jgi:hypothetical protein
MADNTLILDGKYYCADIARHPLTAASTGDEPVEQVTLEDNLTDMDIADDGDDEEEIMDVAGVPEEDVSKVNIYIVTC